MIKQISRIWHQFWRAANGWALAMDTSPLDDLYERVRRLEAATLEQAND